MYGDNTQYYGNPAQQPIQNVSSTVPLPIPPQPGMSNVSSTVPLPTFSSYAPQQQQPASATVPLPNSTAYSQPATATAYSQPAAATAYSQPATATAFSQPATATAFSQPQPAPAQVSAPAAAVSATTFSTTATAATTAATTTTTTTASAPQQQAAPAAAAAPAPAHGKGKHNTPTITPHGNNYQMAVIGGGSVGKSCLTIQFVKHFFVTEYDPTIEDSYRSQVVIDGSVCILNIMDTAGQDLYSAMRDHYYRCGEGFLIVYSVATRTGFDDLDQLRSAILRVKEDELVNDSVPIVLVANKIDLTNERCISTAEGEAKAKQWGCPYVETSAKNRINVDEVFFTLVREIRKFYLLAQEKNMPSEPPRQSWFKRFGCVLL